MFDYDCKAAKLGNQRPKNNYNVPKLDMIVD